MNHPRTARRIQQVQAPVIPEVGRWIAANPDTLSLGQGMVRFPPPEEARRRLAAAWDDPDLHRYGAVPGLELLREALLEKLEKRNGIHAAGSFLLVTAGSNMAFLQTLLAITDPGDEVVLPAPYYFNHEMAVGIAGCRAVVPEGDDLVPTPKTIAAAITPRTRAVVTVSPNNPTGAVYPREMLREVTRLCAEAGIYHISDEAYEHFVYGDAEHTSPAAFPDSDEHVISLFSFSKAYGFAGWRIGYGLFPGHLEEPLMKLQDTNIICPPLASQWAALGALEANSDYHRTHLGDLADVRRRTLDQLSRIEGLLRRPPRADGALYVFLEPRTAITGFDLTRRLIEDFGVAPLPGETFGVHDRCALRVSFGALAPGEVEEGVGRLVRGLEALVGD